MSKNLCLIIFCFILVGCATNSYQEHFKSNIERYVDRLPETYSFVADLDSLGSVNIVTELHGGRRPQPRIYITNNNGEIIFEFSNFQTGTRIINVAIEDVNEDSLKDLAVTTAFFDYDTGAIIIDMPLIKRVFLQNSDGFVLRQRI